MEKTGRKEREKKETVSSLKCGGGSREGGGSLSFFLAPPAGEFCPHRFAGRPLTGATSDKRVVQWLKAENSGRKIKLEIRLLG